MINPTIIAAVNGAVVAIFGILMRDLVIATRIKRHEQRIKLLTEKLSNLYSPLIFYMGGPNPETLGIVENDQELNKLVKSNLHLLSPYLLNIICEVTTLGRSRNGQKEYTADEMPKIIEFTELFRARLLREYEYLRHEYLTMK